MIDKGLLQRVQFFSAGEAFDGGHLFAADFLQGELARTPGLFSHQYGAGPTQPDAATELGSGQCQLGP